MFERKDITTHTRAINEIVRKYCEENGLCFEPGNIKYSGTEFCYKCSVKAKDDSGNAALNAMDKYRMEALLQDAPEEVRKATEYEANMNLDYHPSFITVTLKHDYPEEKDKKSVKCA